MNWISVNDRLPEDSGQYLVCANDGYQVRISTLLFWIKNKTWQLTGRRSYWKVTHWMPLPEPPEVEE